MVPDTSPDTPRGTVKYLPLSCGKHWRPPDSPDGPCRKCAERNSPEWQATHQRNGVPWSAVLGPPFAKPDWWP